MGGSGSGSGSGSGGSALDSARLSTGAIECYFGRDGGPQLVKHQVDSYNDFVARKLEQIVDGFNPIDMNNTWLPDHGCYKYVLSLRLCNVTLAKPTIVEKDGSTKVMLPNDARLRNLTYAGQLSVDVHVTARTYTTETREYTEDVKRITNVALGRLPIMVRSRFCMLNQQPVPSPHDECRYDYGGYFIINGNEKVVISQDRIAENRTYVFASTKVSSYSHVAEVRSVHEGRFGVPKTTALRLTSAANQYGHCVRMTLHHVRHDVPIFIIFRALGVLSDREIMAHVVHDVEDPAAAPVLQQLTASAKEAGGVRTQAQALEYIAAHLNHVGHHTVANMAGGRVAALQLVLRKDVLPHVGPDPRKKAAYLGSMLARLLRGFLGLDPLDDRDSFINKRLDTVGALMSTLVRQYYGKVVKDLRTLVQRDIKAGAWRATNKLVHVIHRSNIHKLVKPTIIESGLKSSLATGNWGVKTGRVRPGVAQVLNRMTFPSTMSHMRRVNTPIEKTGKLVQPRKLHPTQWGVICPAETPEGASVGLVKNLALLTHISLATPSDPVRHALLELGMEPYERPGQFARGALRISVNGDPVGTHADPPALHAALKRLKRRGELDVFTSIVWRVAANQLEVCTEAGRFLRPLFVVEEGRLALPPATLRRLVGGCKGGEGGQGGEALDWMGDLVLSGAVEYLDVEETNTALVAMTPADLRTADAPLYTHMELAPSAMLGVVAGSIPFAEHNQGKPGASVGRVDAWMHGCMDGCIVG